MGVGHAVVNGDGRVNVVEAPEDVSLRDIGLRYNSLCHTIPYTSHISFPMSGSISNSSAYLSRDAIKQYRSALKTVTALGNDCATKDVANALRVTTDTIVLKLKSECRHAYVESKSRSGGTKCTVCHMRF